MDMSTFGYLLFVLPGFVVVWSYRHFTKAKQIGDFEYAAWSFVWGTFIFFLFGLCIRMNDALGIESRDVVFDPNNPFELFATILGAGFALAMFLALPVGYGGAWISKKGYFQKIDNFFFRKLN